jgi:hypothetical protein
MDALGVAAVCLALAAAEGDLLVVDRRGGEVSIDAATRWPPHGGREWRFRLSADGRVELAPLPPAFAGYPLRLDADAAEDLVTTLEERRRLQDPAAAFEESIEELDQVAHWLLLRSGRPVFFSLNPYPEICEPERRRRLGLTVHEPAWCREFAGLRFGAPRQAPPRPR